MSSNRREFIRNISMGAAGLTIGGMLVGFKPSLAGKPGANDRVNLACVGIGNQGATDIMALYNTGLCNIVALCDTDMGARHTERMMNQFPDAARYNDFRKMFDKMANQIDAVLIATPDHSHFPVTMLAMSLGKAVFVEKPLARTFQEVELMMQAAKRYNVVTQMGNQGHSEANYFQFKAWTEAGIIKDVTAITAHMNSPRRWHGWDTSMTNFPKGDPIPSTLDWDGWVAAAEMRDFHRDFVNGQWRCWYDFGLGALGDWGAHIIDTAHRFLDLGLPYEIDPIKIEGHNRLFFPQASTIAFRFPQRGKMPACDITWYDGVDNIPSLPEGFGNAELDPNIPPPSNGAIQPIKLNPGKEIYSKDLIFAGGTHGSTLSIVSEEMAKEMESKLPEVPQSPSNHYANFLKAVKGEEVARSPFEVSGPLSQVFSLGVLAQQLNVKLTFDRDKKQIVNNELANKLLVGAPPRKGWEEFYKL
ncbi:Gfo/Idh/MocA family oxidoreductase [Alkaliflexus imshenetskii]|uniref:Gfo/Idh/MocA family oxidoreductase n=1 Tax=Alkaliflexus imshenetskii TaxID=286730 RepID=UPI0004798ED0|nr:Gfo/Idh/MocA family oxidoreductase [Alkaliflexus imshenetskii]